MIQTKLECPCCDEEVVIPFVSDSKGNYTGACPSCKKVILADFDASTDETGTWRDDTTYKEWIPKH